MILYRLWGSECGAEFYPSLRAAKAAMKAYKTDSDEAETEFSIDRFTITGKQGVCNMINSRWSGGLYEESIQDVWPTCGEVKVHQPREEMT